MEEKLIIIDGSSMLVTAFWGTAPKQLQKAKTEEELRVFYPQLLQTTTGIYTNAVYTMLGNIMKIIREQKPTHMAVVFDKSRETLIRKKWYPDYKARRRDTPEALRQQFITIEEVLVEMGIFILLGDGYEADDYAGSLVKKFELDIPIVLITKDEDYLQLVSNYTKVWMLQKDIQTSEELYQKYNLSNDKIPFKAFEYDPFMVYSEYGIFPEQIIDMKSLQGDSSDNIPGVSGVASAAIPLLQKYGTTENIFNVLEGKTEEELEILKEEWKEIGMSRPPIKILTAEEDKKTKLTPKETALLSKKLATIIKDIPIDATLDNLKIKINRQGYLNSLKKLEIKNL